MAIDKLIDSAQLDADLTSVANAIRTKGGTSAQLAFPAGFVSAINAISGGGSEEHTYTHTEDWDSSTYGLASNFAATYCNLGDGYYHCVIDNTSVQNLRGLEAYVLIGVSTLFPGGSDPSRYKRGSNTSGPTSSNVAFWIGAGSTIHVEYTPLHV